MAPRYHHWADSTRPSKAGRRDNSDQPKLIGRMSGHLGSRVRSCRDPAEGGALIGMRAREVQVGTTSQAMYWHCLYCLLDRPS
jgi:hypothetical protein